MEQRPENLPPWEDALKGRMSAAVIMRNFGRIEYKANDGRFYPLKDKYPLCMPTTDSGTVCLDTGGEMGGCDFFVAKIEDGKLFRQNLTNEPFHEIAEVRIVGHLLPATEESAQTEEQVKSETEVAVARTPKVPNATCEKCSRYEGILVPPETMLGAKIVVVGEAPGVTEFIEGKPFVGKSGQLLRSVLGQLGLTSVHFTNACLCHAEGTPTPLEVDCCRERLIEEIKTAKPEVVVLTGAVAVQALLGGGKITDLQGLLLSWIDVRDDYEVQVIPCFHPAALLRRPDLFRDFVDTLDKCKRFLEGQELIDVQPEDFGELIVGTEWSKAAGCLESLKATSGPVSLDVETSGYNPYTDRILCMGLAVRKDDSIDRYAFPWDQIDRKQLQELLNTKIVVYYNGQFDVQFLKSSEVESKIGEDAILQNYIIDTRPGALGLKDGCRKYLNAPDWEEELKQYLPTKLTSFAEVPMEVLLKYTSLDAAYTLAFSELLPTYMDADDIWVYRNILLPATNMFVDVSRVGMLVDLTKLEQLKVEYVARLGALAKELAKASGTPTFNPRSVKDCQYLLYEVLKLTPINGSYTTGREVLEYYSSNATVQLLREFREKQKLLGTYLEGLMDDLVPHKVDGKLIYRIHPNLKLFGTTTGRISSNHPNMLGLPKEKGGIRRMVVADEGKLLAMMDFRRMELVVASILSGDKNMQEALSAGRDFHGEARERLFGKKEAYTHQEVLDGKMMIFGPLYGRGIPSMARQLKCPIPEAQKYYDRLFAPFKVFLQWSDAQAKEAVETGEIKSFFGRKRKWGLVTDDNLKDIEHEARNHPVSSTASDVNLLTMLKVYNTFDHSLVMPLLPIHDAFLMSVDEGRAESLLREVEQIATTYPSELLHTDMKFSVETTVGKEWL